jgi:hypothetical protein
MTPAHGPLAAMYVAVNRTAGPGPSEDPGTLDRLGLAQRCRHETLLAALPVVVVEFRPALDRARLGLRTNSLEAVRVSGP